MNLWKKIQQDQLASRKERNVLVSNLLGTVLAEILKLSKDRPNQTVVDGDVVKIIKKFVVTLEENVKLLTNSKNQTNLASTQQELQVLKQYLPQELSESELKNLIETMIKDGNTHMKSIMELLKTNHSGQYDGKLASRLAQSLLNS